MRSSKQGSSQDPIINEIKRLRAKTVRKSDKKLLDDATAIHVAFPQEEASAYESRIFAAKDVRGTVSMIVDKARVPSTPPSSGGASPSSGGRRSPTRRKFLTYPLLFSFWALDIPVQYPFCAVGQ